MSLIDDNWEKLFELHNIERRLQEEGLFYITADQIRTVKEPRLMTKFDKREALPDVFQRKYGILPVERGKYVIGEFELFEDFPEMGSSITRISSARLTEQFETIDLNDIRSEANAINIMHITGILGDFLAEEDFYQTVSGRMGSGCFDFHISSQDNKSVHQIMVKNSQLEIDAGFENRNTFSILEGKNIIHNNFLIRQLFYPLRLWRSKLKKTIRPVFMVYSNQIFRLLEYKFVNPQDYNSIQLVQEKNYSLEDIDISWDELYQVYQGSRVLPEPEVTFIQADSFGKVISLVEHLAECELSSSEIADLFGFQGRQADYYYNACKYLGLTKKQKNEQGVIKVKLTDLGQRLNRLSYKSRQLAYVELILQHRIFHELFQVVLREKAVPNRQFVIKKMEELNLCSSKLIGRRASSVIAWLRYICRLVQV